MSPATRTRPKKERPMSDQESRSQIELAIDNLMRRDLITRRTFMRRAGRGGLALGRCLTLPSLLAACAPGSSQSSNARVAELAARTSTSTKRTSRSTRASRRSRPRRGSRSNTTRVSSTTRTSSRPMPPDLRAGNSTGLGRHVPRRLGRRADGAQRLARGARPLQAPQLDRQLRRLREGPVVRPGQQVQRLVAGRHHRASPTTRT